MGPEGGFRSKEKKGVEVTSECQSERDKRSGRNSIRKSRSMPSSPYRNTPDSLSSCKRCCQDYLCVIELTSSRRYRKIPTNIKNTFIRTITQIMILVFHLIFNFFLSLFSRNTATQSLPLRLCLF